MPNNVKKQGSARRSPAKKTTTTKPGKRGPKPGYKRSAESIAKAVATRKANAKKKGKSTTSARATTSTPRGPRGQVTFKLYAADGNELAYLVDAVGRVGDEAGVIHQAVSSGQIAPNVPIVAVSTEPVVIQAIPQDPIFVIAGAAPKRRGRPPGSTNAAPKKTTATTGKKRGPKPGYKRSAESIAKAKATRAANAKKKAKAAGAKSAPAAPKAENVQAAPPTPPPVPAVSSNPFAE